MAFKKKEDAIAYQNKYIAKTYDRINLVVPKGEKARIKSHADECGESVNAFINRAIQNQMEQDNESHEE